MSAQERLTTILHAWIEELALDIAVSFRQFADSQRETKTDTDARFDGIEAKIAAMETRILDAFKDLLTIIDQRLPSKGRGNSSGANT